MYTGGKAAVYAALSADAQLTALIPADRIFNGSAKFSGEPVFPYLTSEELNNSEGLHADDEEAESEVTFRINVFGTASITTITGHIDRIMKSIGYGRNYMTEQDEVLNETTIVKHAIMSFTGNFAA